MGETYMQTKYAIYYQGIQLSPEFEIVKFTSHGDILCGDKERYMIMLRMIMTSQSISH